MEIGCRAVPSRARAGRDADVFGAGRSFGRLRRQVPADTTLRPNAEFEIDSGCGAETWGCGLGRRLTDWRAALGSLAGPVPTMEMSCFGREDPARLLSVPGARCPAAARCVFKLRVAQWWLVAAARGKAGNTRDVSRHRPKWDGDCCAVESRTAGEECYCLVCWQRKESVSVATR
ncbi:hypothetical protein VTG60DRAFT_3638 [Thermothelomyces hinnuleus]